LTGFAPHLTNDLRREAPGIALSYDVRAAAGKLIVHLVPKTGGDTKRRPDRRYRCKRTGQSDLLFVTTVRSQSTGDWYRRYLTVIVAGPWKA
jgi:hypothetical protein